MGRKGEIMRSGKKRKRGNSKREWETEIGGGKLAANKN